MSLLIAIIAITSYVHLLQANHVATLLRLFLKYCQHSLQGSPDFFSKMFRVDNKLHVYTQVFDLVIKKFYLQRIQVSTIFVKLSDVRPAVRALDTAGKCKVHPRTGHEGTEEEQRYSATLSLTSALYGVGGQRHTPAILPPEKRSSIHSI
jgi:hypothetical protein